MNNELYLRRRRSVSLPPAEGPKSPAVLAALVRNIHGLGYTLSLELQERVSRLPQDELAIFYTELVAGLQELTGYRNVWKPFYPNFPAQVMKMSQAELYLNALVHYITNIVPKFEKNERPPFDEQVNLKAIKLGSVADFESIFSTIAGSKTSISETDKEDLRWFVGAYKDDILRLLPEQIPSRETLAILGAVMLKETNVGADWVRSKVTTATDVLRLAVAMNGGDVSLAQISPAEKRSRAKAAAAQVQWWNQYLEKYPQYAAWMEQSKQNTEKAKEATARAARFGKFSRPQRKFLLELLEKCPNASEDMLRWSSAWVNLAEKIHPGEWAKRFPHAFAAFEVVRGNQEFSTFNAKVEVALQSSLSDAVVALLQSRPGDFARRLDHLLRRYPQNAVSILDTFFAGAEKISTPVLLQVLTHFKHRARHHDLRIFFPKGDVAKVWGEAAPLTPFQPSLCKGIVERISAILVAKFAALPPLGACYLDPELKNFLAPFSQRSASKTLRTLSRGSRLSLPEANTIRFFIWWRNGRERTDLDLSAAIYDANFIYKDVISYYNLKNYGGHHSGDIVDAPKGAAEFIDIDRTKMLEMGARYVVMSVNSFTSQPYCDLPECFAGWMARRKPGSGEIFEPASVQDRIDLSSDTSICLPLVMDLESRTVVWMDLALRENPAWNNVQNNLKGVSLMLRAMINLEKTNLHDLFSLHVAARGHLVENPIDANQVFAVNEGLTPFDLDRIAADWM